MRSKGARIDDCSPIHPMPELDFWIYDLKSRISDLGSFSNFYCCHLICLFSTISANTPLQAEACPPPQTAHSGPRLEEQSQSNPDGSKATPQHSFISTWASAPTVPPPDPRTCLFPWSPSSKSSDRARILTQVHSAYRRFHCRSIRQ